MPDLKILIVQICIILLATLLVGWLLKRLHQPQVVGEMVAGIMLGPSLLGRLAPQLSASLFPPESFGLLNSVSQLGLVLFMFVVGIELDRSKLKQLGRSAVIISQTSILVPLVLGAALASFLYPRLADKSVSFTAFLLFMGTAMSVTAFPVLARILIQKNLIGTKIGTLAIACAAVDDVAAWCLLAIIIAVVKAGAVHNTVWLLLAQLLIYVLIMFYVVKPVLAKLVKGTHGMIGLVLVFALVSSLITELIGIHMLFGAFLAGVILPKDNEFVTYLRTKMGRLPEALFLPLFFALTGLRTDINLISDWSLLLYSVLIIFVALAGKLGASMLAARVMGMNWSEAAAIGTLLNTRGLIELVILNIGLDLGVMSKTLFSMMVAMAILTTLMTGPLLSLLGYGDRTSHSHPVSTG
ncbi:MAG TPA: cation:proton antiporter [Pyrinomonadaceae bacterium]|nr:cation:proton antiporter [Pyrinomonadaceae bacterium]